MSNTLRLQLTFSEHSSEQQRQNIKSELDELFSKHAQSPRSISCREGSTVIYIEYVLDAIAVGFLGAVGEYLYSFASEILKRRKIRNESETGNTNELANTSSEEKDIKTFCEIALNQPIVELKPIAVPWEIEHLLKSSGTSEMRLESRKEDKEKIIETVLLFKFDKENGTTESYKFEHKINK